LVEKIVVDSKQRIKMHVYFKYLMTSVELYGTGFVARDKMETTKEHMSVLTQ
jgi:hypothetical protein